MEVFTASLDSSRTFLTRQSGVRCSANCVFKPRDGREPLEPKKIRALCTESGRTRRLAEILFSRQVCARTRLRGPALVTSEWKLSTDRPCGDRQSGLWIALNRPVPRFAVDQRCFEGCSGLVEFVSGRRDFDTWPGCCGCRIHACPRLPHRVPQVAGPGSLLFVGSR